MTEQVNDLNAVTAKLLTALGNGRAAAEHVATLMASTATSRDTTFYKNAILKVEKKGDRAASRIMRQVFATVFPGAKVTGSGASIQLKIEGIKPDAAALDRMAAAVKEGLSLRDTFLKRVKGEAAQISASERNLALVKKVGYDKAMAKVEEMRKQAAALEATAKQYIIAKAEQAANS